MPSDLAPRKRYVARLCHRGQRTILGYFNTQEEASKVTREARAQLTETCPCGRTFPVTTRWTQFCNLHGLWASQMRHRYGVDNETLAALLVLKDDGCTLCGLKHLLSVDHCHNTGLIRGWLCRKCNTALGLFNDNVEMLQAAIEYLEGR